MSGLKVQQHWAALPDLIAAIWNSPTAAAWFSAVGTIAAVFVSLYLLRQQIELRKRDENERLHAQARRVHMSYPRFYGVEGFPDYKAFDPYDPASIPAGINLVTWRSEITNQSNEAVSNVIGRIESVSEDSFSYLPDGGEFSAFEIVARLLPGDSLAIDLKLRMDLTAETGYNNRGDIELATYLQFTDAEGRIWHRDPWGRLHLGKLPRYRAAGDPPLRIIDA